MHDDNDDSSKSDRATTWWLDWSVNAQETVEYCGHKYVYKAMPDQVSRVDLFFLPPTVCGKLVKWRPFRPLTPRQ